MKGEAPPASRLHGDQTSGLGSALSARVTRDSTIYAVGSLAGFVLALINVAVVTRFLPPAEFGQLALLLVFAAFLTVTYNLGILQGTFVTTFGAAGEEDIEDEVDEPVDKNRRRTLGTGLTVTVAICVLGTAAIAAVAPLLAELILGDRSQGDLIVIAALAGASGAVWRLASNVLRLERRPYAFVAVNALRPFLIVGAVVPLIASGQGIEGAIIGTAAGGWVAVLLALLITRRSYTLTLDRGDLRTILQRGLVFVPIVISFWVAQNVDLYALAQYTADDEVGLYRVAGRVGAFISYFSSAVFMAWTPLRRTSTFEAAAREQGASVLGGGVVTYFAWGGMLLLVALTVAADGLIRIAPPAYEDAAPLIPLLAGGFLAHGFLVAIYRVSTFPRKQRAYIAAAIGSAVVFLGAAMVLIPWLGADGAALSVITGFGAGTIGIAILSQRGSSPLRIEYARLAWGAAIAGLCLAVARGLGPLAGTWQPAIELVALLLFPLLLFSSGALSRGEWATIKGVLREAGAMLGRNRNIADRLRALPVEDRANLGLVVAEGRSVDDVAAAENGDRKRAYSRLVGALRGVAGLDRDAEHDSEIGEYLFSERALAERDAVGRSLWSEVDPAELHVLERTLDDLRRLPAAAWPETSEPPRDAAGRPRPRTRSAGP